MISNELSPNTPPAIHPNDVLARWPEPTLHHDWHPRRVESDTQTLQPNSNDWPNHLFDAVWNTAHRVARFIQQHGAKLFFTAAMAVHAMSMPMFFGVGFSACTAIVSSIALFDDCEFPCDGLSDNTYLKTGLTMGSLAALAAIFRRAIRDPFPAGFLGAGPAGIIAGAVISIGLIASLTKADAEKATRA